MTRDRNDLDDLDVLLNAPDDTPGLVRALRRALRARGMTDRGTDRLLAGLNLQGAARLIDEERRLRSWIFRPLDDL